MLNKLLFFSFNSKRSLRVTDKVVTMWSGDYGLRPSKQLLVEMQDKLRTTDPCGQVIPRILHIARALVHQTCLFLFVLFQALKIASSRNAT